MNENLRSLIPGLNNKIYFNYGGQGPLPQPSLNEIIKSWETIQKIGPFTNDVWHYINKEISLTKKLLSRILGVNLKNIALSENISTGIVLPLWGIDFNTGDEIYDNSDRTSDGFIPTGTTITGFGTAVGITSYVQANGITTAIEVVFDFATLSNPVSSGIAATIGRNFHVGVISAYNFAALSDPPVATGLSSSFLVVRPGDIDDIEFESSKNPIDPVEIGIAEGANVGKGHRLELINNGDPKINPQWSEITSEPEPAVGAGRVEYYIGDLQWPTIRVRGGDGEVVTTSASLGQRVIVSVGSTTGAAIGYTGTPPSGTIPSDCGTYDSAITTAESEMNAIIAQNTPLINYYISGAVTLRQLRDTDEGQAWGYLQAIGYANAKGRTQLAQAESLEDFNWNGL